MHDPVNHPDHYCSHPSGVECIRITEHFDFCIGNAIKYLWRAGLKADRLEDLEKAQWYINREIQRLKHERHEKEVLDHWKKDAEAKVAYLDQFYCWANDSR